MLSQQNLDAFMEKVMSQLGLDNNKDDKRDGKKNGKKKKCQSIFTNLTPAEILVISGILTDVLSVQSFLVDRNQQIQIVLGGSLRRKTELEKTLDEIGDKPFDEVLKALLRRM